MYKGTDIVGKQIISHSDGKIVEKIKDVVFDANQSKVLAFLVDEKGVFSKAKVLPFENIQTVGKDAVTILNESAIVEVEKDSELATAATAANVAKGTKVMSEDGRDLGKITDIYFDQQTGRIDGYEVSGGLFSDAYTGKSYLPAPESFRIGEDVAFVSNDIAQQMQEDVSGIKGAFQQTGEKLSKIGTNMGNTLSEMGSNATEKMKITGRRLKNTVYDENGFVIAAQGQIVTESLMEKALQLNRDKELYAAAFSERAAGLKNSSDEALQRTSEGLSQGFAQLKEKAGQTWNRLKDKNAEMVEERKIHAALGRPVTRVILDQQDQPILNTGELVTHEAVERAREEDALDILLDSVYTKDPDFSSDELKAAGV